jgi:hypothetical protein
LRSGGLYDKDYVQKRMDRADEVEGLGANLSKKMDPSGRDDISIQAMQRLFNQYVLRFVSLVYIPLICSISSFVLSPPFNEMIDGEIHTHVHTHIHIYDHRSIVAVGVCMHA